MEFRLFFPLSVFFLHLYLLLFTFTFRLHLFLLRVRRSKKLEIVEQARRLIILLLVLSHFVPYL